MAPRNVRVGTLYFGRSEADCGSGGSVAPLAPRAIDVARATCAPSALPGWQSLFDGYRFARFAEAAGCHARRLPVVQSEHLAGVGEDDRFQREAAVSAPTGESCARMGM